MTEQQNFGFMKYLFVGATSVFVLVGATGCGEYIPRTVYELKTVDGKTIKLACPAVDAGRSEFTYLIDGDCVVYKQGNPND